MLNKKIMILAILLVTLLAVSAVSAADNATEDIVGVEETTDEVVSIDNNNQVILEETNVGTFTDLAIEIANANGELNLNRNYTYCDDDSSYKNGINIDKSITINGKGFTINGNNQAGIIRITASNVVLNNINFVNCSTRSFGAAVNWQGKNGGLFNCSFVNCSAASGGAIYWYSANGNLSSCSFIECSASDYGGAVYWDYDAINGVLSNCSFIDCSAISGGAVYWSNGLADGILTNCCFASCSASSAKGGAVLWGGKNGALSVCIFVNCSASSSYSSGDGGAVYWDGAKGTLSNCSFIDCSASSSCIYTSSTFSIGNGGAVYWFGADGVLANCSFANCSASSSSIDGIRSRGCAVYWFGADGVLANCSFMNSSSYSSSGAVYWDGAKGTLSNCSFINNFAVFGAAVSWYGVKGIIVNCNFYNNLASGLGNSIVWIGENGIIKSSYFSSNFNNIYNGTSDLKIIKIYSSSISCENISFDYSDDENLSAYINNTYGRVIFNIFNDYDNKSFIVNSTTDGIATLNDELNELDASTWNLTVIFEGNDNYESCNATATITVLPASSSLTIDDINTTWDQKTIFTANVMSDNKTINEGIVSFYIDDEFIGNANVLNGVASLTHEAPGDAGNHILTAVYNGDNYLSSNNTAKLFVDTGDIPVEDYDSVATFKSLAKLIENTPEGGILNLSKDYYYVSGSIEGIQINKAITIDGKGHSLDGNKLSRIFYINAKDVILKDTLFINGKCSNVGGAICWYANDGSIINCTFKDNNAYHSRYDYSYGGAIYIDSTNFTMYSCIFENNTSQDGSAVYAFWNNAVILRCNFTSNSADGSSGALYSYGNYNNFSYCNFLNNIGGNAGGLYLLDSEYNFVTHCNFTNNTVSCTGGGIYIEGGFYGYTSDCIFLNNKAIDYFGSAYGGAVHLARSEFYSIKDCYFYENYASNYANSIYLTSNRNVNIFNCTFENLINKINGDFINSFSSSVNIYDVYFNLDNNCIKDSGVSVINFTKHGLNINYNNINFTYSKPSNFSISLESKENIFLVNKPVVFDINEYSEFYKVTDNMRTAYLFEELTNLNVGTWNVTVIFEGNDNYYPCNASATITVLPASSSLTIDDINATVGHEITLIANVNSNLTVNEGTVSFFDGESNIGDANVYGGVATLTYTPETAGEHKITAVFNSNNYLSSNGTAKLLVDTATVEVLAETGTVGFNSEFIANVKGLYSTINEGTVSFYIDDEYLGKVNVVNGFASINYMPLNANTYTIKVVYGDSVNFLDAENTASYTVNKADSEIIINDIAGTVGHELTITTNIISSNNLTINEGTVTFFDGQTNIGEANLNNGFATLTYTPTTAGEHTITAKYYADNYQESIQSALLSVAKADVDLSINSIADVYFTEQSVFTVNVNSNNKAVREGGVKFYVNDVFVGLSDVYDGMASFNYVTDTTGSFTLTVVYGETENYLASNTTSYFTVNKMPTALSGESVIYNESQSQTFKTVLKDKNGNGVEGQTVKIEAIKTATGESKSFIGMSDSNGIVIYDLGKLAGGAWYVSGTFNENNNYLGSTFTDKFIVIRMDTTTEIEEIANPRVNHTYKLKANIHDENGKLVKEGIVQFYLDGVDIGSIDLSQNQGHQSGLLSAVNPMFECILSVDDSDVYLEYTPSKAGNFLLSAVYEGTSTYKSSNSTTKFFVLAEGKNATKIVSTDVTTVYNGGGELVATLINDDTGKVISGANVIVNINNVDNALKTNTQGEIKLSTDGLNPNTYVATITYKGNTKYGPSSTTVNVVVNKADTSISAVYDAVNHEIVATLTNANTGKAISSANVNLNGATDTVKTNSKGQAKFSTANLPTGSTVTISYDGNSKYNSASTKVDLVNKIDMSISAVYKDSQIVATLTNGDTGKAVSGANVQVEINGVITTVKTNTQGQAKVSTSDLPSGTFIATISYAGNSKYNAASTSITFATKMDTTISAIYDASNSEIVATLTNAEGKALSSANVKVTFNGETTTLKTNSKGQVKVSTAGLPLGTYPATFSYAGNSKYNAASTSINVEVKTKVIVTDVYAYSDKIVAKLTNGATGKFIANANMIVEINGVKYNAKSDNKGQLTFNTKGLNLPDYYDLTISYRGNDRYTASSATVAVDLNKANMMITTNYHADKQKLVATLKNSKTGKVVSNANMIIELNGVKTTYKSNDQGKITLPTADFAPGTYVGTVTYPGNARYNSISAVFKVDV